MAYAIARTSKSTQSVLLLIIILAVLDLVFLLRVYALEGIIRETGLLNSALFVAGASSITRCRSCEHPLRSISASSIRTCRFMVLPAVRDPWKSWTVPCSKRRRTWEAPPWRTFVDVTLPAVPCLG